MEFEWDPQKSTVNKKKHGIDFEAARNLWLDEDRIEIEAPHPIEERTVMIARLHEKIWTAIYTVRAESIRLISVRRARDKEKKLYEKEKAG